MTTAVKSSELFDELSKLIKFPPETIDVSIHLKTGDAAIIEARYYLTVNDRPEQFTKRFKLVYDE